MMSPSTVTLVVLACSLRSSSSSGGGDEDDTEACLKEKEDGMDEAL